MARRSLKMLNVVVLVGGVIAYYLPWLSNRAAALSANAYDLAEWVSIHPAVRGGDGTLPPLFAPLLLRAVLGGWAVLFGWQTFRAHNSKYSRIIFGALAIILALTLLPPPDFFRAAGDDPNYRQQFSLALAAFILLALGAALRQRDAWLRVGQVLIALLAASSAIAGEALALNVVRSLGVPAPAGIGIFVTVGCLLLAALLTWRLKT